MKAGEEREGRKKRQMEDKTGVRGGCRRASVETQGREGNI